MFCFEKYDKAIVLFCEAIFFFIYVLVSTDLGNVTKSHLASLEMSGWILNYSDMEGGNVKNTKKKAENHNSMKTH